MTTPTARAPRHATSAALSVGAAVGAVCFVVALIAEQAGIDDAGLAGSDVVGVLAALPDFDPSAWASLGVYVVVLTPVLGIGTTAWEYWTVEDARTVGLAIAVLAILGVSLLVALLR